MGSNQLQFKTNKSDHFSGPFLPKNLGVGRVGPQPINKEFWPVMEGMKPITAHLKAKLPITAKQLSYLTI
jgi:hypothetical protein